MISQTSKNAFRKAIGFLPLIFVILFLLFLHGTFPFIQATLFTNQAYFSGPAKCIGDSGNVFSVLCNRLGYPVGYRDLYGYPIYFLITLLYKFLSISPVDGIQIANSLAIILGAAALYLFVKKITRNDLAGLLAPILFYGSPFIVNMAAFPGLYQGFLLLPFFIIVSLFLYSKISSSFERRKFFKTALWMILQIFLLLTLILIDGYSYVMAIVAVAVVGLIETIRFLHEKRKFDLKKVLSFCLYIVTLLIPGIIYRFIVFEDSVPTFSMEFFRGQGIDLITLLVPTKTWLFAKLLGIGQNSWNAYSFFGDGYNANYNFIGLITFCVVVAAIYLVKKKVLDQKIILTLVAVGGVGFIMSLGPSLKINDTREVGPMGELTGSGYMMKPEEATLSLPTAVLYQLPVISTMRATYRWQVVTRLALICIICVFIAWLYGKKKIFAFLLSVLLIFECLPTSILNTYDAHVANREKGESFNTMVVSQLSPQIQNKRVIYLPEDNDFLVSLISPYTNSFSYNVFFDKEWVRIRNLQSPQVLDLFNSYANGTLRADKVCSLLKTGLADSIIFLNFNLRWDSYAWPPTSQRVEEYQKRIDDVGLTGFSGLKMIKNPLFLIVSPDTGVSTCLP